MYCRPVVIVKAGPCPFRDCTSCRGSEPHVCRICNAVNAHRSVNCTSLPLEKRSCVFNCGYCRPGQPHDCKHCHAKNNHRSDDCPYRTTFPVRIPAPNWGMAVVVDRPVMVARGLPRSHFTAGGMVVDFS